jgi:hypothetical protein
MAEDLLKNLRLKLAHMKADPLARPGSPWARLSEDAGWDPQEGTFRGAIEVLIKMESGKEMLLRREPLDGVVAEEALDDRLAEALSRVLMDHPAWSK